MRKINITDVALRDGLQNISQFIPTDIKTSLLDLLINCGIQEIEVTSFVHPKAIAQFSDAEHVLKYALQKEEIVVKALVPNLIGAKRAIDAGARELVFVFSASEVHNQNNVKMSIDQSLDQLKDIMKILEKQQDRFNKVNLQMNLATTFGYHGEVVPLKKIKLLTNKIKDIGVNKIVYCDTSGLAVPPDVEKLIRIIKKEYNDLTIGFHFHDTYGTAISNCVAALKLGIDIYESSVAGLGGCPFAVKASGNVATEDLVWVMEKMKVDTGIDLEKLIDVTSYIKEILPIDKIISSRLYYIGKSGL